MNAKTNRLNRLMPGGVPKYVRCYDNGGVENGGSIDRFTVCFTGRAATRDGEFPYLAMNGSPFHPQGFGQHGATKDHHCDVNKWGFAPMVGKKNHLGTRIAFNSLPEDCQKLVRQDYIEIWGLK